MIKDYFNPKKILMHSEKIKSIYMNMMPIPVAVEIDPSNACNVKCPWCLFDKTRQKNNEVMKEEDLSQLMDEMYNLGVQSITFTGGGEPLVNLSTLTMIERYGGDIDIGLVTNGVILSHEINLILADKLKYIRVSLDAATKETYLKMKGIDKFKEVITQLKDLVAIKANSDTDFQIGIAFVVHEYNYKEVLKFTELMKKIGVDYVAIRPVIGWSAKENFPKKYAEALKLVEQAEKLQDDTFRVFANIRRMAEVATNKKNFSTCKSTPLIGIIGADMNIYICCQMRLNPKWSIGKIDYKAGVPFGLLWGSQKHWEIIDNIDVKKCVPCRNGAYNEIIESFFEKDNMHRNFI